LKKTILSLGLLLLFAWPAKAQFSGQLSTPSTNDRGQSTLGTYVGIYDDALGVLGQYRYGIGGFTDIGFKLGIVDLDDGPNSSAGFDLNFDIKYQILEQRLNDPIDLSAGGVIEFSAFEDLNIFSVGPYVIGSYPVKLKNGRTLEPYGRLLFRFERVDYDRFDSDSDFVIGFNMGTAFELYNSIRAFGEFQFDDPWAFFLGLDFEL
jgi:hypothetical protein